MAHITAIELENFQSIERRTRIEFKPITLLFGPNSAGKSAVFDALELLRVLLDPNEVDEDKAVDMANRWARRKEGKNVVRETFLAIEFIYDYEKSEDIWDDAANWKGPYKKLAARSFWLSREFDDDPLSELAEKPLAFEGSIVRIELQLKIEEKDNEVKSWLSECKCTLMGHTLLTITKSDPENSDPESAAYVDGNEDDSGKRILMIYDDFQLETGFISEVLKTKAREEEKWKERSFYCRSSETRDCFAMHAVSDSLSPLNIAMAPEMDRDVLEGVGDLIRRNGFDLLFYFGTLLFKPFRGKPGIVRSDRRVPKPSEALAIVDLQLPGWWSRDRFSPGSPASQLRALFKDIDDDFRGMAEAAYSELLLKMAEQHHWDHQRTAELQPVRARAKVLQRINHHLETSLFKEKLYELCCAATILLPIDLEEDDPFDYYAAGQPAAVRLFLRDGAGTKVELEDVGSGVPFVLPVLHAIACGGFVKVQQPELHLHPALQSSIADVFVEEHQRDATTQFLIETHSEHLLLRLLRRIRDVEQGKCRSDECRLTSEDIAVYYFDPQVNGGTVVTRQLVTPLGDFYNEWPRGFFAERNDDLSFE